MYEITGRYLDSLYKRGLQIINEIGMQEESRNGPVLVLPAPLLTEWLWPRRRVLFNPARRCNPFFHVMEALWMLAGRNDVAFVAKLVKRMADYSDNGLTFNGAYGWRWRRHFNRDQIIGVVEELRSNPKSRRCVIAMWDAWEDHPAAQTKDLPCNTQLMFRVNQERLDMTVVNRSNDMIWGLYGANAVHMSFLMEFIASAVGVPMGKMYTLSNNAHVYPLMVDLSKLMDGLDYKSPTFDGKEEIPLLPEGTDYMDALGEIEKFCKYWPTANLKLPFLTTVAQPMMAAWGVRNDLELSLKHANTIADQEWRIACTQWLKTRGE